MTQHRLVMRTGPTPGKVVDLTEESYTIGREPSNDIPINDSEISRKHARVSRQGDNYAVEDLGSTNGTFVNGQRLMGPHTLKPGEIVSFGEQISCTYEAISEVDANATIISSKPAAPPPTAPSPTPMGPPPSQPRPAAPPPPPPSPSQPRPAQMATPSQPKPVPPPSYAGQVPAGPPTPGAAKPPAAKAPAKAGRGSGRTIAIVAVVLILCVCCACAVFFYWVDQDPTGSRWCSLPVLNSILRSIAGFCQ
jgi:pSer/pThr/pTyr-binding forkhead associated (FHA) protein